jgi:hypothetical protein
MHHNIASAFDGMKIDGAFVYGLRIEQHFRKGTNAILICQRYGVLAGNAMVEYFDVNDFVAGQIFNFITVLGIIKMCANGYPNHPENEQKNRYYFEFRAHFYGINGTIMH